ncbi:type II toxin-antitoxin system HicA family toxin [Candidatus Woesearchaeota archaeon]|nr:type II toxin-antitoxin system HicA family toxin [Candidatus Woesearchaeota archaeon]
MKLPILSGNKLVNIVISFGFIHARTTGSHNVLKHPDGRMKIRPVHSGENIGPGLLNKIIKRDLKMSS